MTTSSQQNPLGSRNDCACDTFSLSSPSSAISTEQAPWLFAISVHGPRWVGLSSTVIPECGFCGQAGLALQTGSLNTTLNLMSPNPVLTEDPVSVSSTSRLCGLGPVFSSESCLHDRPWEVLWEDSVAKSTIVLITGK